MLEIQNITVTYTKADRPVLKHFSLSLKSGESCCLVGESGSGKTTVIRAVHGTIPRPGKITAGDIRFAGESCLNYSEKVWQKLRGTEITMIYQDSGAMMNPIRTIGSQFVEYIQAHSTCARKDAWDKGVQMLEKVRLPAANDVMKCYPFQLSGGMKQRVGIAFAMFFKPKLLLADEPTSSLDVTIQAQIIRQMAALKDEYGTGIIMITHNLALAAYLSDHIVIMKDGQIAEQGNRNDILHHPQDPYTKKLLAAVPSRGGHFYV